MPGEDPRLFQEVEISDNRPTVGRDHRASLFYGGEAPTFSLQSPRKRLATNKGFASLSKDGEAQTVPDWMVLIGSDDLPQGVLTVYSKKLEKRERDHVCSTGPLGRFVGAVKSALFKP